jgi:hypothetical protein
LEQSGGYVFIIASEPLFGSAAIWTGNGQLLSGFVPQALTTPFHPAPLTSFAVTGKVMVNDRPAEGFSVVLSGPEGGIAISGESGHYAFTDLPPGKYSMAVDQYGFEFIPSEVNFEITAASRRQDFIGFTGADAIVVQPASIQIGSPDTVVAIFGSDFNQTSEAFAGPVRLQTLFVDTTQLQATVPAYLIASPLSFEIHVVTNDGRPDRRATQPYPMVAFQDRPLLTSVLTSGNIVEGNPGTTITLRGTGFIEGARVRVNGQSDGIQTSYQDDTTILAYVPARYLEKGGIYPVTLENPFPSNVESNVQLLTVFYPAPFIEDIVPGSIPVRLEAGAAATHLDVFGYGFRRGASVLFNGQPLVTQHCENDAYCLATRLFAIIPAELLQESGFAGIEVRNPDPSLENSPTVYIQIEGLQPTITSVIPGSASIYDSPFEYSIPVVVNGTNFGPQTLIRIYKAGTNPLPGFSLPSELLSSTQMVGSLRASYPDALGEWRVEVANPPPGGGQSDPISFVIDAGSLNPAPFLISLTPSVVAAGGPSFTLILNGTNFQNGATVLFYTSPLITTVVSDKQIRAEVPATLIQTAGRIPIGVINPGNGGTSNRIYLDIR